MLVVPMRYDGATIGVITLSKLGLDGFDADDLRLLTILADQAATAVGSARLLTRTQDLAGELRRLLDMSAELSGSLDPRQVADLMAGHLAPAMGVDECVDQLLGSAGRPGRVARLLPAAAGRATSSRTTTSSSYPETLRVLERQETVIVDADDPAADPAEVELMRQRRATRSSAMLPLVAKGQSIGLVELVLAHGRSTCDDERLAAGPDDGQRGRDGARERAALRGRPQPRRPRPADRLLQPPVPARAPRRGGRPRAARAGGR